ncbi:G2/mitotic-specific cyclin [Colletotrichum orchidophilum]|uniref:G2/mitotic-specific cyclin n=1 Tax=Colletotrichum orchidophilum TaxID=1209926 RepID=A0A1G4AMB8_9PEZI|nr:G2/mitotic-specific cyclin [Colletotrichum orchidophilum]OHE90271.1 G2/mitotic-specific cyclin [Colletotrichum orchidophilum]
MAGRAIDYHESFQIWATKWHVGNDDKRCLPREDDSEIIKEYDSASLVALRRLERKTLPLAHYMEIQECMPNGWASRLQICTKFTSFGTYLRVPVETVYLAVNCLDRFLSVRVVSDGHLDVIGAIIFAIAVEFERSSSNKHVKLSGYKMVELRPLMAALWNTSQQEQSTAPIKAMRIGQFQEAARVVDLTLNSVYLFLPRCSRPWDYEGLYIPSWDDSTDSSLENISSSSEFSSQGGWEEET